MVLSMAKDRFVGMMAPVTLASLNTMTSADMASTSGATGGTTTVNGKPTRCTAMVSLDGTMEEYTRVSFNDRKEGSGTLTWPDNRKYEGTWVNGKQDGYGWFTSNTGVRQQGNWVDGKVQWWLDDKGERVNTHISQTEEGATKGSAK